MQCVITVPIFFSFLADGIARFCHFCRAVGSKGSDVDDAILQIAKYLNNPLSSVELKNPNTFDHDDREVKLGYELINQCSL